MKIFIIGAFILIFIVCASSLFIYKRKGRKEIEEILEPEETQESWTLDSVDSPVSGNDIE